MGSASPRSMTGASWNFEQVLLISLMEKIIAIAGGVGPMAGVELHRKIIENTDAGGTYQGHLPVHHVSRSHDIPDRTAYLRGESADNPAAAMAKVAAILSASARAAGQEMVLGIPCNTFHAPRIWDDFSRQLKEAGVGHIQVLHMIAETAAYIGANFPKAKKIGLMSTTGTRQLRLYHDLLEPIGYEMVEVPEEIQDELHDSIYNPEWGLKGVSPVSDHARENFERYADVIVKAGAEVIILGCTEIPLALTAEKFAGVPLVDAMTALARALIREVDIN